MTLTADQEAKLKEKFRNFDPAAGTEYQATTGSTINIDFCGGWPSAKNVLLFLIGLPGFPPVAKDAVQVVIKAGDLAHGVICT